MQDLSVGSRVSVAVKRALVGGRPCSLCAYAYTHRHVTGWRAFCAAADALFWPIERNHTREAWRFWNDMD